MKKIYTLISFLAISYFSFSQTVIYSENFETGNSFTLNTSDVSSVTSGANLWVVNDEFTGGSFTYNCGALPPQTPSVPSTALQAGGQTNGPSSNYLHITSVQGSNGGVSNAHFVASDQGLLCVPDENYFAKMSNDISTTGEAGVTLSFDWLCGGASGAIYGEVYYSTDGGNTWTVLTAPVQQYFGQVGWSNQSITNTAFDNQATLRFGFRFVNTFSGSATDPSFAIDEIEVTSAAPAQSISITENYDAIHCEESNIDIDYTSSNVTFNAGNNFELQMSDNTGSFASPTTIGSLTSTATSGTISGTFPASSTGTGYLLRIVSDNPAVTSTNGTTTLTLNANVDTAVTATDVDLTAVATGVNYTWLDCDANQLVGGATSQNFTPSSQGNYALIVTDNDGACIDTSACYFVNAGVGIQEDSKSLITVYPNPARDYIFIQTNQAIKQTALINVFGQVVYRGANSEIQLNTIASGVYFLKIETNEKIYTKKIIVE